MISLVEALNYRCLRYVRQPLDRFHVLVGPNASGKTTFLDAISFLSDFVNGGLDAAIEKRSLGRNFIDLLFGRTGSQFELAIEATIPDHLVRKLDSGEALSICRYEVTVGIDTETDELGVISEIARIRAPGSVRNRSSERLLFPETVVAPATIAMKPGKGRRSALSKGRDGSTNYYSEIYKEPGKGWIANLKLGRQKSALGNLPEDTEKFPTTTWLKQLLSEGVQTIVMDSLTLRRPSPPHLTRRFRTDCSNLPWVVEEFRQEHPERFDDWIRHLREALPDLVDITTIERPEDRHRYLVLEYVEGLRVPSWTASDGTLRLLALTLPAFLPAFEGVILIEEPENGIHPRAVETMFQAVSNVYDAQVLIATHSPVVLGLVEPEQVLCFSKDEQGATDIVRGDEHPALADWKRDVNLQDYFVAGVLG